MYPPGFLVQKMNAINYRLSNPGHIPGNSKWSVLSGCPNPDSRSHFRPIPIRRIKESIPLGIFVVMMINTINYKLGNDKAY